MSETIAAILGVVVGWGLSTLTALLDRRRQQRDAFAADVDAVRRELAARADNLDKDFVAWHFSTVRRLRIHADYFRMAQPKWWRRTERAWSDYEMAGIQHTVEAFFSKHITRDELLSRLTKLFYGIRDA